MTVGFELQSVTNGMEFDNIYGPAVETTEKHSGDACFKHAGSILASDVNGMDHQFSSSSTRVFARYYFKISALENDATVANYYDLLSGATNVISVQISNVGGTYSATTYYNNFAANLPSTFNVTTGVWHYLEIEYDSTPADGSEVLRVRLDGVEQVSSTALTYTTKTVNTVSCGIFNGSASTITGSTTYTDDIGVNDTAAGTGQTSYPGAESIVYMRPDASGDSTQWQDDGSAVQGTSLVGNIDDDPTPNDATDYNKRTTNSPTTTPTDYYNFETAAAAGIGTNDQIKLVAIGFRGGATSATSTGRSIVLRVRSESGGTPAASGTVDISVNGWITHSDPVPRVHKVVSYDDPSYTSGSPWTPSRLNNMQAGYQANVSSANEIRISALWAIVCFTPVSGAAYTQGLNEALVIVDSVKKDTTRSLLDAVVLVDTVRKDTTRTLRDAIAFVDTLSKQAGKALLEAVTLVDSIRRDVTRSLLDTVVLVDTIRRDITRSLLDTVILVDTFTSARVLVKDLIESIVLNDTLTRAITRTLSETLVVVDTISKATTRTLTDAVVLVDTVVKATARTLQDTVVLVDTFASALVRLLNLTETLTLVDTVRKDMTRTLADNLVLVDTMLRSITRSLAEAVGLTDTLRKDIARAFTETVTLTDVVSAVTQVLTSIGNFIIYSVYGLTYTIQNALKPFTIFQAKNSHEIKDTPKSFTLNTKGRTNTLNTD